MIVTRCRRNLRSRSRLTISSGIIAVLLRTGLNDVVSQSFTTAATIVAAAVVVVTAAILVTAAIVSVSASILVTPLGTAALLTVSISTSLLTSL